MESWTARDNQHGKRMDAESVLPAEINNVTVMRDAVAVITAALLPTAMFRRPLMCATLLPNHAVFRAWLYLPRSLRGMPNRVLFLAWLYMPRTLRGMFRSMWPMLLSDTLPGTFRLFAGVVFPPARLFEFGFIFVLALPVASISAVAVRRNSGSEN